MAFAAWNPAAQAAVYLAVALVGLGAGAAANVCADIVAGDEEPPWRAAACRKCGAELPAARLIPLVNLRPQPRTCVACGRIASLRRPLLEVALAVVFPLLLAHLMRRSSAGRIDPGPIFVIDATACAVLAFIFAVDLEHHLILDVAIYPLSSALLLIALFFDHKAFAGMLFGVVLCGGLFFLLYVLGFLLYHQEALGFGDVKLAVLVGLLAGWPGVVTALAVAALGGAAVSMLLLGLGTATRRTFIPFGIFIAIGAVVALLVSHPIW
ncbi:MAG TPA: A24 family peptidase [Ktedonobacterales bacterium]|nr:A24 family peptidase [Ktedonobacterales bacterium]